MAEKFILGKRTKLDLTDRMQLGPISKQTLYQRFTDGRIFGLLAEDLANALYNNLTKAPSKTTSYDLIDGNGNKYEVRTVTRGGVNLIPSAQIGAGRSYDEVKHQTKHDSLYAYIFIDVRNSPLFYITGVHISNIPFIKSLTGKNFDRLLKNLDIQ